MPFIRLGDWIRPGAQRARRLRIGLALLALTGAAGVALGWMSKGAATNSAPAVVAAQAERPGPETAHAERAVSGAPVAEVRPVRLTVAQQEAIGLQVVPATAGQRRELLRAPGQVVPDETRYAHITPRAAGVVRSVAARIGRDVKAGDLLALVDSSDVAQARLELVSRLQDQEIARARADWQQKVLDSTNRLLDLLRQDLAPEPIQQQLEGQVVGENHERLMTAYAKYRLADAMYDRSTSLRAGNAVSVERHQMAQAEYEAALATYSALRASVGYHEQIENAKTQQALKQAETAVRVARERLRVLGVRPDGTEPLVRDGKVQGVLPDGSLPTTGPAPGPPNLASVTGSGSEADVVEPVGGHGGALPENPAHLPIGTYAIWAPFDGTVLDRELVVPGVYVDTTHRIFRIADLSKVWVQVKVPESQFAKLAGQRGGQLKFTSPAYPDQTFEGRVLYTGDLVDESTRAIQLLAEADNPQRLLKPGMYVDVEVVGPASTPTVFIPRAAVLTDEDEQFVYVRTAADQFERRPVKLGPAEGDQVAVLQGVNPADAVVVEGAFKVKAAAERAEADGNGSDSTTVARID